MLDNLPELIEGRIDCLEIEGLLRSTLYNETVVRSYRAAIDAFLADPQGYVFQQEWLEAIEHLQDPKRVY